MGWNGYDYYDTIANEKQVKVNAKVMAEKPKEFGWKGLKVKHAPVCFTGERRNPGTSPETK